MKQPDLDVRHFSWGPFRGGIYEAVKIDWTSGKHDRRIEVTVSPTGRSVHVYVDGVPWKEADDG